jgi:hypothetical protein
MPKDAAVRQHLVKLLDSKEAHATFDAAVEDIPLKSLGTVPKRWEYSIWQLVEHIRIAQADILDFSVNAAYEERLKWPDDYWPRARAPKNGAAWKNSLKNYRGDEAADDGRARTRRDHPALHRSDLSPRDPPGRGPHRVPRRPDRHPPASARDLEMITFAGSNGVPTPPMTAGSFGV